VAAVALLHVVIVVLVFAAGRMQLAPRFLDGDGIVPGSDSITYQHDARQLAVTLRQAGFGAWRHTAALVHVRLLSLVLALFPALSGYGILAAEPLNLVCYLAVISVTFAIGRETGSTRSGLVAAAMIALWPTFVFHTTQFLKDPLFIAGALALVFIVVTWLTRTYDWRAAAGAGMAMSLAAVMLFLIRAKFVAVIVALIVLGAVLLLARQLVEKRLYLWNAVCALATLAVATLMLSQATRAYEKVKVYPSPDRGEPKSIAAATRVPAIVVWRRGADPVSLALGSVRARYIASDRAAASGIDDDVNIESASDLVAYAPRAAEIGLWAPFPNLWFQPGLRSGKGGRLIAGAETFVIYLLELLTIPAVLLRPRRAPALLLLLFALLGVTMLGLVVTNIGTLYRFRYSFWILLIVTGVSGGRKLVRAWRSGEGRRAAAAVVACFALMACSCARPARGDLIITNLTGTKINALYLSPSDSPDWQENVLGRDVLRDGDTAAIRFRSRVQPPLWDLRVDAGVYRAEWLRLDRTKIAAIALRLGKNGAVAELR
jgi:hypothetical protein